MDIIELKKNLSDALSGRILQFGQLGRDGVLSVWIEAKHIDEVALLLRNELLLDFSSLENFFVAQIDSALILSYFLCSPKNHAEVILRASVVPQNPDAKVRVPSVREIWPMIEHQERESSELFGLSFFLGLTPNETPEGEQKFLPSGWEGFPLRKEYTFPETFLSVRHQPEVE